MQPGQGVFHPAMMAGMGMPGMNEEQVYFYSRILCELFANFDAHLLF